MPNYLQLMVTQLVQISKCKPPHVLSRKGYAKSMKECNSIKLRSLNKKTYSRAARALSTVTLSSVASRFNIPKSKYLISKSR